MKTRGSICENLAKFTGSCRRDNVDTLEPRALDF
jgi:hypothetical protein